jgi:hypothetical protein
LWRKKKHVSYFAKIFRKFAIYEIVWKNIVEADKSQMTIIRLMRFVCQLTKDTNKHTQVV